MTRFEGGQRHGRSQQQVVVFKEPGSGVMQLRALELRANIVDRRCLKPLRRPRHQAGVDAQDPLAYAAYGGVYIVASLLWLWGIESVRPDRWDITGAAICLIGAAVILSGPRG